MSTLNPGVIWGIHRERVAGQGAQAEKARLATEAYRDGPHSQPKADGTPPSGWGHIFTTCKAHGIAITYRHEQGAQLRDRTASTSHPANSPAAALKAIAAILSMRGGQ